MTESLKQYHPMVLLGIAAVGVMVAVGIFRLFVPSGFSQAPPTSPTTHNVFGYAWSSNIGWISMSCDNTDTCASVDYGVDIENDGNMTGFAWSSNIGWIDFDPEGKSYFTNWPSSPNHSVQVDTSSRVVSGWARVVNADTDDSYGWVLFGQDDGSGTAQVLIDDDGKFTDWAFGGPGNNGGINKTAVIGWVSVNCSNTGTCSGGGSGGGPSDYFVETSFPFTTISIEDIEMTIPAWCDAATDSAGNPRGSDLVTLTFDYTDTHLTAKEAQYRIAREGVDISTVSPISSAIPATLSGANTISRNIEILSARPNEIHPAFETSESLGGVGLRYGRTYNWQVRVIDPVSGDESAWEDGPQITMTEFEHPYVEFTWKPEIIRPAADITFIPVEFGNLSFEHITAPDGGTAFPEFRWFIDGVKQIDPTNQNGDVDHVNPSFEFDPSDPDGFEIQLDARDLQGQWCSVTNTLETGPALPNFDETGSQSR